MQICRKCGTRLDSIEEGQEYHPLCYPEWEKLPGTAMSVGEMEVREDLLEMIQWGSANTIRSKQVALGCSEAGQECDRRIAYKMAGAKQVNFPDPLKANMGTAFHVWLDDRMRKFQAAEGMDRWITETEVYPASFMKGHVDLYDKHRFLVLDWKAQPDDEIVLTPRGWVRMDSLKVGDHVIGANGRATQVTGVFPQGEKEVYRITTSDGASCEATLDHLWTVRTRDRKPDGTRHQRIMSTAQIIKELEKGRPRWSVLPELGPVQYESVGELPVDPYALGLLLGDGSFRGGSVTFANADGLESGLPFDLKLIDQEPGRCPQFVVRGAVQAIRDLGLHGSLSVDKHIPEVYLKASVADRLALLQGLMDTDGYVAKGNAHFCTSSEALSVNVTELVRSLGGKTFTHVDKKLRKGASTLAHLVSVRLPNGMCPFRADIDTKKGRWRKGTETHERFISTIEPSRVVSTRCIKVQDADQLYVTRGFLVTHNTTSADMIKKWKTEGIPVQYKVQVMLYGKGMINLGYRVDRVGLIGINRSGALRDIVVLTLPYDDELAVSALRRIWKIGKQLNGMGESPDFAQIGSAPDLRMCGYCPQYRGGTRPADTSGCPGRTTGDPVQDLFL